MVFLYDTLATGSNDLSTTFFRTIQDGTSSPGPLEKIGSGALSLSGANSYTGLTTVSAGTLLVKNTAGPAPGTGAVQVSGATLGGRGIFAGVTTIGIGSGTGAFLQPDKGSK